MTPSPPANPSCSPIVRQIDTPTSENLWASCRSTGSTTQLQVLAADAGYFQKIVCNLIQNRTADFFQFLFNNDEYLLHMTEHVYSRSIANTLILLLNTRKTLKITSGSLEANNAFEAMVYTKRKEKLNLIIKKLFDTCDSTDQVETHLNCYAILIDAIDNFEAIYQGDRLAQEVFLAKDLPKTIAELIISGQKSNIRQIPEFLNQICNLVRKLDRSLEPHSSHW